MRVRESTAKHVFYSEFLVFLSPTIIPFVINQSANGQFSLI